MLETLAWFALFLSALPIAMALINVWLFRPFPDKHVGSQQRDSDAAAPAVSLLIPTRDEASRIGPTLDHALASEGVTLEMIVLDDGSTDDTHTIVQNYADRDTRLRLIEGTTLPPGWSGKQHACYQLASAASHPALVWIDADVHLTPDALRRAAEALHRTGASLISGFPRQVMGTFSEKLVIPMIHTLLLGYLPMAGMRWTRHPGFAAGCGQFFIANREAYEQVGGHRVIAHSFHDGITLPRAFRAAGHHTLIFDATDTARCRMYESFPDLWWGFAKNAHEGMATPVALPIWTVVLLGGHVLPWLLLALALLKGASVPWLWPAVVSAALSLGFALALALRYRHPPMAVLLRPLGVVTLLAIQWHALIRRLRNQPALWRGRPQPQPNCANAPHS
jgi:hypothetical protein